MYGFTFHEENGHKCFEHKALGFQMLVNSDGSGDFRLNESFTVHIPPVNEINLGGLPNPQTFANIRHDIMHVFYCYMSMHKMSPNHLRLLALADTPLYACHWEEYKVESLEIFLLSGYKREILACYTQAKEFYNWFLSCLNA